MIIITVVDFAQLRPKTNKAVGPDGIATEAYISLFGSRFLLIIYCLFMVS